MSFEKYEKDGKIAVLVSPGFGAGWSTWNSQYAEQLLFDKRIVERVLREEKVDKDFIKSIGLDDSVFLGGADELEVEYLEKEERFYVIEYDGSEELIFVEDLVYKA